MEQAIAAGMVIEDKNQKLVLTIDNESAQGFITDKGNRSVSSAGFRPVVWGGRVWNLSLNLYAVATDSERKSLPAKPKKEGK